MRKLSLSEILPTSTQFLSGKAQIQTRFSDYFICAQALIINTSCHGIFPRGIPISTWKHWASTLLTKAPFFFSFKKGQGKSQAYAWVLVLSIMLIPLPLKPTTLPQLHAVMSQICDRQLPSPHPMLTPPLPLLLFFHTLLPPPVLLAVPQKPSTLPTLRVVALSVPSAQKTLPKVFPWFQVPRKAQLWIGCPWPLFLKECPLLLLLPFPFFLCSTYIYYVQMYTLTGLLSCSPTRL